MIIVLDDLQEYTEKQLDEKYGKMYHGINIVLYCLQTRVVNMLPYFKPIAIATDNRDSCTSNKETEKLEQLDIEDDLSLALLLNSLCVSPDTTISIKFYSRN